MEIAIGVLCLAMNLFFIFRQLQIKNNNLKQILKWQSDQLKYQKHLRNSFDYLNLMQNAMSEGDFVTFLECSMLVREELNRCNEVIGK